MWGANDSGQWPWSPVALLPTQAAGSQMLTHFRITRWYTHSQGASLTGEVSSICIVTSSELILMPLLLEPPLEAPIFPNLLKWIHYTVSLHQIGFPYRGIFSWSNNEKLTGDEQASTQSCLWHTKSMPGKLSLSSLEQQTTVRTERGKALKRTQKTQNKYWIELYWLHSWSP